MSMQVIEHIEVGSGGTTEIEFASIPATYTDLYLVFSLRTNRASNQDTLNIKINGDDLNRTWRRLRGSGSSASSSSGTDGEIAFIDGNSATSNTFGNGSLYIPNYTSSNYKSISADSVDENNATAANQAIYAGLWSDTSSITSLGLRSGLSTGLLEFSSATLYGITAGSDGTTTVS